VMEPADGWLAGNISPARASMARRFSLAAGANFAGARFYSPSEFDPLKNASQIDFTGAHIGFAPPNKLLHWTKWSLIPLRWRAFRKVAEETKNHDLVRDLYIEESKAERGVKWRQIFDDLKSAPKNSRRN
jgi:hypothetical protein